ncbi:hypothetical protein GQ43DRAFT_419289 [Delitschia confertaspora ATCC 74209]|uniref:Complex 1 LYR protein domain-containing protein n=1 Tax=Delitschia confertaspora ATCC 74209 TaxID=1513339 RepID=A0A9P4JIR7_9PLEO|nr:hypothetical protein GQ43DRAFT_419289 [Delitschia confertaspora ATCC 74209]
MPRFLLPKRSSSHRIAAIALFRALLSQCSSAPISPERRSALGNAIRHQFRKHKDLQSPYQLQTTFQAGYELLDRLDEAAAGNLSSTRFVKTIVDKIPDHIAHPKPRRKVRPKTPKPRALLPKKKSILETRPYPKVTGKRHIPILATANGIPFLRITKPQPTNLSRALRHKINIRNNNFVERTLLGNYWMPLAIQEDQWDDILDRNTELSHIEREGGSWQAVVHDAFTNNRIVFEKMVADNISIAKRMQDLIDQEKILAGQEEEERKHAAAGRGKAVE